VVKAFRSRTRTGEIGDGKIFISTFEDLIPLFRTAATSDSAAS